jgi:hypothetical protein
MPIHDRREGSGFFLAVALCGAYPFKNKNSRGSQATSAVFNIFPTIPGKSGINCRYPP